MDATVLGDLVARERRSDAPALRHAPSGREYDYRRFCTTAWKVGNLLRNEGVRGDATVVVADDPAPEPVLALYGVALLGATVHVGATDATDAKALVAPTARLSAYDTGTGTRLVGYGDDPDDPAVAHFESEVWSENPTAPPDVVGADDPVLRTAGGWYDHGDLLAAARSVLDEWDLAAGDTVAVRAPLAHPGTVAAGLVAPLLAGAAVLFPDEDVTGDVAVGEDAPEPSIPPEAVLESKPDV